MSPWLDEEKRIDATVEQGAGLARAEQRVAKTGLQIMFSGELPYAELAITLTFGLIAVDSGDARQCGCSPHLGACFRAWYGWVWHKKSPWRTPWAVGLAQGFSATRARGPGSNAPWRIEPEDNKR